MLKGRIILTGPPCSGKSTVIKELERLGSLVVPEVARPAIAFFQEYEPHKVPWIDRDFFQNYVETVQLQNFFNNQRAYFDRGLIDEVAYRWHFGMGDSPRVLLNISKFRYDKVFFFPYWEEIYQTDEQRIETKLEAQRQENLLLQAYKMCDYETIIVPKVSVEERVNFIFELQNQ